MSHLINMKRITIIVQTLMLIQSSYQQERCKKETALHFYHIYNANVKLKTYYCFYKVNDDFKCEKIYNGTSVKRPPSGINCEFSLIAKIRGLLGHREAYCEVLAEVNLLDNTVTLPGKQPCHYKEKYCWDKAEEVYVHWMDDTGSICKNLSAINGHFDVWTLANKMQFISQHDVMSERNNSLLLTKDSRFCNTKIWKTDYSGFFVSSSRKLGNHPGAQFPKFRSNPPEGCKIEDRNTFIVSRPKLWYIYKYPVNVTVHFCITDNSMSCKDLSSQEADSQNKSSVLDECRNKFCTSTTCTKPVDVCSTTLSVDLEGDRIEGIENCAYSQGICKNISAFWRNTDRCGAFEKISEGQETQDTNTKTVILDNKPMLTLTKKGKICGQNIWYTYDDGIVASERLLQFSSNTVSNLTNFTDPKEVISNQSLISEEEEEIMNLHTTINHLIFLLIFCAVCYLFNVVVNFCSLRKMRRKGKFYWLNCFSQSLTTRYLFLNNEKIKLNEPSVQASQLYASVDNELYNK